MQSFPYLQSLAYLKELERNIQGKTSGKEAIKKKQDYIRLILKLPTYQGSDIDIRNILIEVGYLDSNIDSGVTISNKGKAFLKKYSGCVGYIELLAKDYPLIIGTLFIGIIVAVIGGLILYYLTKK